MNPFAEIIVWLVIVVFITGAISTIWDVHRHQRVTPVVGAVAVGANACVIIGLLYVLWSTR